MSDQISNSRDQVTGPSRGPAPPLPEKPPSVAERTRLLRSSFRKDDVEKPKVPEKPDNRTFNGQKQEGGSVNGERSPSPPSSSCFQKSADSPTSTEGRTSTIGGQSVCIYLVILFICMLFLLYL